MSLNDPQSFFLLVCFVGLGLYVVFNINLQKALDSLWKFINEHSSFAVAVGTLALAFFTVIHIREATQMRLETKRLVDVTVEQFKIKAYPAFSFTNAKWEENEKSYVQRFEIINQGELPALNASILLLNLFEIEGSNDLQVIPRIKAYYDSAPEITSLDFERNIKPRTINTLVYSTDKKKYPIKRSPKFALIFVKFWVPYDYKYELKRLKHYSYETCGYILENKTKWQMLRKEDKLELMERLMAGKQPEKIKESLKDYPEKMKEFLKDYRPE